jgi:Septum formation
MRCAECGQETAGSLQYCAACGAPITRQRSAVAEPTTPAVGDAVTSGPQAPSAGPQTMEDGPSGQRAGRSKLLWVAVAGAGFLALLGVVLVTRSASTSTPSSTPSTGELREDQLRSGDCLQGSNLVLGSGNFFAWPHLVTAVPCAQQHLAEVFFAGNAWPRSRAFPGENVIANQGLARCRSAFRAYDGIVPSASAFTIDYITPDSAAWASSNRRVICVAYQPWAPVTFSIKSSHR